jgi:hypothetical protein
MRNLRPPLSRALGRKQKCAGAHWLGWLRTRAGRYTQVSRLRYYMHDGPSSFRFKLAGSLAGADVVELRQCWSAASSTLGSRAFVVDIDELSAVDEAGRELLRQWQEQGAQFLASSGPARGQPRGWLSLRCAALVSAVLLSLLLPATVRAATPPLPKLVLARYAAILEESSHSLDCRQVSVEIEASLPKLAQRGRLQAIRRMVSPGKHEYRDLQVEGDRTVRQQVIARYLSAEAQAEALPSGSVAVSLVNYKFHYVGSIGPAGSLTYVFTISPRKKRVGLIQGELWIDAASGLPTRKAGRLVKTGSVFVRHIDVVQDIYIRDEAPYLQVTHLEIGTRLAGRAELTIRERICAEPATITATQGRSNDELMCSTTP